MDHCLASLAFCLCQVEVAGVCDRLVDRLLRNLADAGDLVGAALRGSVTVDLEVYDIPDIPAVSVI